MEQGKEPDRIDENGFVIGNCANLDKVYGLNTLTGTRYSKGIPQFGIPGVDVNGFSKNGIHLTTGLRYDTRFFRFDDKTQTWVNLHTGKDEDLLGFNHEGIRVNPEKGRVGFDRNGLWHKKLDDGTYSKETQKYDDKGYNVYGFNSKNKALNGSEYINGFYRVRRKDGREVYINKYTGMERDIYGFDIDGFDKLGFNRDGINKDTGTMFNRSGIKYNPKRSSFPILEAIENGDQTFLTEFIIMIQTFPNITREDWYRAAEARQAGLKGVTQDKCDEYMIAQRIMIKDNIECKDIIDSEIKKQEKRKEKLNENRKKVVVNIKKLVTILKGDWIKAQGGGER